MPHPAKKKYPPVLPAVRIRVRALRANLKLYLEGSEPLIIGSYWHPKAIILPVALSWERGTQASRIRDERLRALLESALDALDRY